MGFKQTNLEVIHEEENVEGRNGGWHEGTQLARILCKKKVMRRKKKGGKVGSPWTLLGFLF